MQSENNRGEPFSAGPVNLGFDAGGVFAAGTDSVKCFCLGKGKQAFLGQYAGDIRSPEGFELFKESYGRFRKRVGVEPVLAAADLQPGDLLKGFAHDLGLPLIRVQRHHALIASCMAENSLEEDVIGVAFGGAGYGDDGNLWGGEFLLCSLGDCQRHAHLEYLPLPGGDAMAGEPGWPGFSLLNQVFGSKMSDLDIPFINTMEKKRVQAMLQAIDSKRNAPLCCAVDNLFNAVSAILEIENTGSPAEASGWLESIIEPEVKGMYSFIPGQTISVRPMTEEMVEDIMRHVRPGIISAKFHNTMADIICVMAENIRKKTSVNKIVLSGETFRNRFLLEKAGNWLRQLHFEVFSNGPAQAGDGGIALGQLTVAAHRRETHLKNGSINDETR